MSNIYVSKYPSIVVDKSTNSVNESLKKVMTVEEYYDLKHHTHDISSLAVSDGNMTYNELQTLVTEMSDIINNLNDTIEQQNTTIEQQNDIIQRLEADTTELKELINTQNNVINKIKLEMENMASVSDWDIETPGIQDAEGNTLGDLMGFTMTELPD